MLTWLVLSRYLRQSPSDCSSRPLRTIGRRSSVTGRRILLASFVRNSLSTGMGRWSHEISRELRDMGHHVTTWFSDDFPHTEAIGRYAVLTYPLTLANAIRRNRQFFDVVVVHEPSGLWYGMMRRMAKTLPPMVAMCHNVESHCYRMLKTFARQGLASVPLFSRIKAPLIRHVQSDLTIRISDHVVCLSTTDCRYVTDRLGVPAQRVTRLVNGASEDDFISSEGGTGSVLWVGGWLDIKGRRVLPRVWRRIRETLASAHLTIVGTGIPEEAVLRWFPSEDRESVNVISWVDDPSEMRRFYSTNSVFLMTSLSEGSPLALLQALAAGMPCVVSNVGGISDIVTADCAKVYSPGDVGGAATYATELLSNPRRAEILGDRGRERARRLTWHSTASQLLEAIDKALIAAPAGMSVEIGRP